MSDLISRGDAIKAVLASNLSACTVFGRSEEGMATAKELIQVIKNLPSAQPDKTYERGWNDAIDAIMSEAPTIEERKTGEWLHEIFQDAIDDGIITEAQAVRIMERVKA